MGEKKWLEKIKINKSINILFQNYVKLILALFSTNLYFCNFFH